MKIKDLSPSKGLSDYIKCFRVVHILPTENVPAFSKFYVPKPEMVLHSIVKGTHFIKPKVNADTVLNYDCFFAGQQIQPFIFSCNGEAFNFQIVFTPTAFYKLTGIPASELTNSFTEASLVLGNCINTYLDQLRNAATVEAMVKIGESFVYELATNSTLNQLSIDRIFKQKLPLINNITVADLAKENYVSEKQFNRIFSEKIGIKPKLYLKIVRFHKAYTIKNANPDWDWLRIAIESGFYDYQHLTKEYHFFTQHTPLQFHQQIEAKSPEMLLGIAQPLYKDRFKEIKSL